MNSLLPFVRGWNARAICKTAPMRRKFLKFKTGELVVAIQFRLHRCHQTILSAAFGPAVALKRVILQLTNDPVSPVPDSWPEWLPKMGYLMSIGVSFRNADGAFVKLLSLDWMVRCWPEADLSFGGRYVRRRGESGLQSHWLN
jgi:hypothetical protein